MKKIDIYVIIALTVSSLLLLPTFSSASTTPNVTIFSSGIVQYSALGSSTPINRAVGIYGISSLTDAQTSFIANHFTLLDTEFYISASTLQSLKTKNPILKIIGYKDLIAMQTSYDDWAEVNTHEDWFVHDINGKRLVDTSWGWYLMDINSTGWRQHYVSYVNTKINNNQFDGVFADDCWNAMFAYRLSELNGTVPDSAVSQWHQNMIGFLQYIKANLIPGKLLIINTDEWQTHDYLNVADGKMDEGFAHASWQDFSQFDSRIPQILDNIARDSATGKIVWCFSDAVIPSNPNATVLSQVNATVKYCYAAFLLALNGSQACLSFDSWWSNDGSNGYYPIMDTNIGQATGAYYASQNVYMRNFTGGKVLLNPSGNSYNVNLGRNYQLLNGTVVPSIVLDAWSGEILLSST
jgi:hypothetical protein